MRTVPAFLRVVAAGALAAVAAAGCGGSSGAGPARPSVVVTTSVLGDVVSNLLGGAADVAVLMPRGADPHEFAPSAQQIARLRDADAVVRNGLSFESGLDDTIRSAQRDGTLVLTATDHVTLLGQDPHFFTDPARMRVAAAALSRALQANVAGLDVPAVQRSTQRYLARLDALDHDVEAILAAVPAGRRALVTNHEVFGYFADRYGFRVLGTVIPSGTTLAEPSAAGLRRLAQEITRLRVPAIFADTSAPTRLADALAAEGVGVQVVTLYSESLGADGSDGATYIDMMRTDAERIAAALD